MIIDDSEDDARVIEIALRKEWSALVVERTESAAAMGKALEGQAWDCVLCDMLMPQFSAAAAKMVSILS